MIYSNLLKSTALIAGLSASANALTHYKSGEIDLVKRASDLGNTGITYDVSEDGLSTTATFNVDYDDVVIAKGYAVSEDFTLTASDSGFELTATYGNTTEFCQDADKWMIVYSYDGSTPALIAPDCDNYFTLLEKDGSVIDWKAGGCVSIGSFAAANPACAAASSSSSAATAPSTSSGSPTTFTEIVITETVSGVSTEYTTYCPLTSGEPNYSALSTSIVTVSEGVTTTVVVPCTECAAAASSAASAKAATATGSATGGLFVETTYVTGTTTVTSLVPCPSTSSSAPTTFTEVVITKTIEGTSTEYTTYCPLTAGKPNYSALSTSVETVSEGVTTTVVIPCSECAADVSSAVNAKSAAAATGTGAATTEGLFVETTYISGTATVTSYVPCPSSTGPAAAATATGVTTTAPAPAAAATTSPAAGEGESVSSTVFTTYTTTAANGKSSVVTSAVAGTTSPAAGEGESVSSTVYTTYSTTAANGVPTTVTSAVSSGVPVVNAENAQGSSSTVATGAAGSATPSVLEGGASIKLASSGLIGAAIAMFLL